MKEFRNLNFVLFIVFLTIFFAVSCSNGSEKITYVEKSESTVTYTFHETVTSAGTVIINSVAYDLVFFGDWPQTIKNSAVKINENQTKCMGSFTYYAGSDGNWYVKSVAHPFVYSNAINTCSDGTPLQDGKIYYFRVEPIKWRVHSTVYGGKKLLLAEKTLMGNVPYYISEENRIVGTETIYPNNYKYSTIRAYLNGSYEAGDTQEAAYSGKGFLQSAFTEKGQGLISLISVDNSAMSTNTAEDETRWNSGANDYVCGDTSDKIFLLSEKETTTVDYGFEDAKSTASADNPRRRYVTDFAIANKVFQTVRYDRGSRWWMRSPYYDSAMKARLINVDGGADSALPVYCGDGSPFTVGIGIVPALCIEN